MAIMESYETPSVDKMKMWVRELYASASSRLADNPYTSTSSGGFKVTTYKNGNVEIIFVLEESSVDWEE